MPDKDTTLMARCPECDSRVYFERRPDVGQIIVCPECETSLEVISANPVRLDWAFDEGERSGGGSASDRDEFDRDFFDTFGRGERASVERDFQDDDEDDGRY